MKTVTIEIDDNYKDVIQFTCIGGCGMDVNICTKLAELADGCHFIISKDGKIEQRRDE